jgi:hypothetical protein
MPRASKKRAAAQSIDKNVPHKRQKNTALDEPQDDAGVATGSTANQHKKKRIVATRHMKNITKSYSEETKQNDLDPATADGGSRNEVVQEAGGNTNRVSSSHTFVGMISCTDCCVSIVETPRRRCKGNPSR